MSNAATKRPLNLTLFAVWIAILGGISLARSALLWQQVPVLTELGRPTNGIVIVLGIVWGMGLLAGAVGLWLRRELARRAILFLVPAYYLTQWLYAALTSRASYGLGRLGPYTALALLVVSYSTWFLTRRRTRQQFRR